MTRRYDYLPFEPLLACKPPTWTDSGKRGAVTHGGVHGNGNDRLERAWHRAAAKGLVTRRMADEICVHILQRHPSEVFGELWWSA